jgi:hypothetical protein
MYAYFFSTDRRRCRFWREEVLQMPLLRIELPQNPSRRCCGAVSKRLRQYRVHRVLNLPERWLGEPLPPLLSTRPIWWAKAAPAALLALSQAGLAPQNSVVELWGGNRLTPAMEETVRTLAPYVRGISLPGPAHPSLGWDLQRQLGLALQQGAGDLTLAAAPVERKRVLALWPEQPRPAGMALRCPKVSLPDGCPVEAALEALQSQGLLHPSEIQVRAIFT